MSLLEDYADRWIPEPNTGCYLWHGWTTIGGYPRKMMGKKGEVVTRLILEEAVGPPPTSKHFAAHDTPNGCCGVDCINPDHLRWATHRSNMLDIPPKKRIEMARKCVAAQTPEQHSERARKGWATRRAK